MSSADPVIDALRSGHDELVVLVADLDHHDLTGPSAASEWDLSQVLSHLGSGAEISLGALQRAIDPSRPQVPNTEIWDRWNAMSPVDRLAGFLAADESLVEAYQALDEATRDELRIDLGFLPEPVDVATAAGFRLNEFALHSWDVRSAFDPAATVAEEAAPIVAERLLSLLGWISHADAVEAPVTLVVETTDPAGRFGLSLGDTVSIGEPPESADGTLTLPTESWVRLVSGRLGPDQTPESVSLASEAITLADLRRVFPGY